MHLERCPRFTLADAEALALEHYGIRAKASSLASERDQNFKLAAEKAYVLKVSHPDEALVWLEAQRKAVARLAQTSRLFAAVLPSLKGEYFPRVGGPTGQRYHLWLIPFLPGGPAAERAHLSPNLLFDIGQQVALMDLVLGSLEAPAFHRPLVWAAETAPATVAAKLSLLSAERRPLVERVLGSFEDVVTPRRTELRKSVVHNDVNDYNLLLSGDHVSAILDFGDMLYSYTLCDPAHACAYLMLGKPEPLAVARQMLCGYLGVCSLNPAERYVLYDFIRLRLALSVTLSAQQQRLDPHNAYLGISERPAWALLERLDSLETERARAMLGQPFELEQPHQGAT